MKNRDPYWTTARYSGQDANGRPVKKGDRIFYYPNTRTLLTGPEAEKAAAEFHAAASDEAFLSGQTW